MDEITVSSTSWNSAQVLEPIVIYEKDRTRFIFIAETNDVKLSLGETVSGTFVYQRKTDDDKWEDAKAIKLSQLKAGEGVKWHLNSEQIKKLYEGLTKLYTIANEGIQLGIKKWTIAETEKIIEVPDNRIGFIKELLKKNYGEEVWNQLTNEDPDLATKLSLGRIQSERIKSLELFEEYLEKDESESFWQDYFFKNQWIFGYGLKYVFIEMITQQPNYGNADYTGRGKQKGDFLLSSSANVKYTILVEIKRPDTLVFKTEAGDIKKYRNGVAQISEELIGAISQLQINCMSWEKEAHKEENLEKLTPKSIYTVNPKGILVIGNTKEFINNKDARNTFELYRTQLNGIEIITFDELLNRAKYITKGNEEDLDIEVLDDEF